MKEYTMQVKQAPVVQTNEAPTPTNLNITQLLTELKAISLTNDSWLDNVVKTIKDSNISKYAQGYIKRMIDEDMTIFLDHERGDFKLEIQKYICKYGGSE